MKPEGAGAGPGLLGRPARRSTVLRQASLKKKKKIVSEPLQQHGCLVPSRSGLFGTQRSLGAIGPSFPPGEARMISGVVAWEGGVNLKPTGIPVSRPSI